jgi:hypothetical protein
MHSSAGVDFICLFVNGSNRNHPLAEAVYTPKGLVFVEGPLRKPIDDLLRNLQTFAHSGTEGTSGIAFIGGTTDREYLSLIRDRFGPS